jgi:Na+/H+ antiporter NhaD/arsenite permease-like protein
VWSHSPARAAGLLAGDVVHEVNGRPVSTPADVDALLSARGTPKRIDLAVTSDGRMSSIQIVLTEKPDFALNIEVVLLLLGAVFALLYFTSLDRVAVVSFGAVIAIVLGTKLGFYDQKVAFASIRMSTLALLLGMGLITAALEEAGLFVVVAREIGTLAGGDWSRLMVLLCVVTFFLSSFVNNLTTILVVLPVTLSLTKKLGFAPAPFVIGQIVSSNLGGASSMIGDFPNMLIASETGRHFHDFLLYMMPPCLVQLAITIWFMRKMRSPANERAGPGVRTCPPAQEAKNASGTAALARGTAGPALGVLAAVIVAFFFCGRFAIPPATVALAGGSAMLLLWKRDAPRLVRRSGWGDVVFFAGLFVLVGFAGASGLLDVIATWMVDVSGESTVALALILMWGAALVTTFLNAGPTTALFVPIVAGLGVSAPHGIFWWSLSLGVCAGSSATVTGATAGPVALSKVEEFVNATMGSEGPAPAVQLSFASYARTGVPLMLLFLLFSTAYVWTLSVWA